MGNILGKLGAEFITIESRKISAIPAEVDVDRELMGGSREERERLIISFQPSKI